MPRSHNPRRKPKSKLQIFKEAYLPVIIIILTLVLAVVFIIGGINRRNDTPEADQRPTAPAEPALPLRPVPAALPLWRRNCWPKQRN